MSSSLQPALDRLNAAALELREAADAVLTAVHTLARTPHHPSLASITLIQREVASYYGITPQRLAEGPSAPGYRTQPLATARQMAMRLCREFTPCSAWTIAPYFGLTTHGSILFAVGAIAARCEHEIDVSTAYVELRRSLREKIDPGPPLLPFTTAITEAIPAARLRSAVIGGK